MSKIAPYNLVKQGGQLISENPALAQKLISEGLKQIPEEGVAWFNLALSLHQQRKISGAIKAYQTSLVSKNSPINQTYNNLAQDLLLAGRYEEGWEAYEYRYLQPGFSNFDKYNDIYGEAWTGFNDKRKCENLVIIGEQGLGDTLQFCRLITEVRNRGQKTTFFCPEILSSLLKYGNNIGEITRMVGGHNENILWCPLLSLPHRLGITKENIPLSNGYISLDRSFINKWKILLKKKPSHRLIALHWQGNPNFEKRLYGIGRSMDYKEFLPLKDLKRVEFISIQKGPAAEQLDTKLGLPLVNGQSAFDQTFNFLDTAAVLANCDLLISNDSSVVHLAGAMNIPTWIALKWIPEWRWGLEGETTPWYRSVRLFRQPDEGNWTEVMSKIRKNLL